MFAFLVNTWNSRKSTDYTDNIDDNINDKINDNNYDNNNDNNNDNHNDHIKIIAANKLS